MMSSQNRSGNNNKKIKGEKEGEPRGKGGGRGGGGTEGGEAAASIYTISDSLEIFFNNKEKFVASLINS